MDRSVYFNIAKKVHPDRNPDLPDAVSKMQEVNKFKNNPDMLLKLAKHWGLNLDGSFNERKFDEKAEEFKERVFRAVVGAIVKHVYPYRRRYRVIHGVIIKVRDIQKGKFKGAKEFTVYNFATREIWKTKSFDENPFSRIVGMAEVADVNMGIEADQRAKALKVEQAQFRQENADAHFVRLELRQNKNYDGMNVRVQYRTKWMNFFWANLVRTTGKSVFVWDDVLGKQKRIDIAKVVTIAQSVNVVA